MLSYVRGGGGSRGDGMVEFRIKALRPYAVVALWRSR